MEVLSFVGETVFNRSLVPRPSPRLCNLPFNGVETKFRTLVTLQLEVSTIKRGQEFLEIRKVNLLESVEVLDFYETHFSSRFHGKYGLSPTSQRWILHFTKRVTSSPSCLCLPSDRIIPNKKLLKR